MTWVGAVAIYFVVWWLVLFTVLPWGAASAHELGRNSEAGHAPSAPVRPHLAAKFAATTVIAAAVFAAGWWLVAAGWLTLDTIPFLPDYRYG